MIAREPLLKELNERLATFGRRLKAAPARVSGAFAQSEKDRREFRRSYRVSCVGKN
jgi:hypothetical protein